MAVSQHAVPPALEDCRRRISGLEIERDIIAREAAVGIDIKERAAKVAELLAQDQQNLVVLEKRWELEKALVDKTRN